MTHEHLTDEQLSAYLDGEVRRPFSGRCRSRRGAVEERRWPAVRRAGSGWSALSRAQALVRLPVDPVLPSIRATAVASALAEGSAPASEPGPVSTPTRLSGDERRKPKSLPVWVGAAAALVLVVVGVSLGLAQSGKGPTATSAAAPEASTSTSSAPAGSPSHSTFAPGQRVPTALSLPGGLDDLGSFSSAGALKTGVARALDSKSSSDQSTSAPGVAAGTPANASAQPPGFATATSAPAAFSACVTAAQRTAGVAGTTELVATATYRHTPALVVVVDVTDPSSAGRRAVVVARTGCRVLTRIML